ncbi:MAG: transglutaminase family protein [Syntrophotaleaceae bacterium]
MFPIDDMEGAGLECRRWSAQESWPTAWFVACADSFSHGGLLHFGQGKWYPGEQLPRWAYGCFWRKDGIPVWKNPELLANIAENYDLTPTRRTLRR